MVQKSCEHQLRLVVYPIVYQVLYIQTVGFLGRTCWTPSAATNVATISAVLESLPFSKVVTPPRGCWNKAKKKKLWKFGEFSFFGTRDLEIFRQNLTYTTGTTGPVNGGTLYQRVGFTAFQKPPMFCISFLIEVEVLERSGKKQLKLPSWWFQPIWKILVNLDHFPK